MIHLFIQFFLLCINQQMLQTSRILSNTSLNIEEYSTGQFDCLFQQYKIAAWRISLRHDNIYRYYYIDPNFRNEFLQANENVAKSRDITFKNNRSTIIFSNVRQWINSAFENIQCLMYTNTKTTIFEIMIFYLNVYVSPFSFSMHMNRISMKDQSIFAFNDSQHVNAFCEVYSYPKSTLQFILNKQKVQATEKIDCLNDDLSTILLSDSLCLSQTNWRIRVRINISLYLSKEQNLTCSIVDFPYGISWNSSINIQLIKTIAPTSSYKSTIITKEQEKSIQLSTSSSFKFSEPTSITFPILSSTQITRFQRPDKFLQGIHYRQFISYSLVLFYFSLLSLSILFLNLTEEKFLI